MLSIDAFLARRGSQKVSEEISSPTFSEIGKAAIAYQLMQCEDEAKLLSDHDDHWYQHLWSRINDSLEEFGSNQLRIISFNYDRSLEHYLLMSLQNAFGVTAERAGEELRKIPFLHVYGQLGGLPEMKFQGLDTRRYISNALASSQIASAASGIRVIDEHRDDDEIFAQAYGLLANAQRICFIGFGFDDTNVRRLQLAKLTNSNSSDFQAYATTFGLATAERQKVIQLIYKKMPTALAVIKRQETDVNISPYSPYKTDQYLKSAGVLF